MRATSENVQSLIAFTYTFLADDAVHDYIANDEFFLFITKIAFYYYDKFHWEIHCSGEWMMAPKHQGTVNISRQTVAEILSIFPSAMIDQFAKFLHGFYRWTKIQFSRTVYVKDLCIRKVSAVADS